MHGSASERSGSVPRAGSRSDDQPDQDLIAEGGTQIVWEDRWHEEEIFANRLSFYILAQSFLVVAAVTATLSTDATSRWFPVAVTIDLVGLLLTVVSYALTENLRRLDALKKILEEGSHEMGVHGYREIGAIMVAHHEAPNDEPCPCRYRFFGDGHPRGGSRTGYLSASEAHGSRSQSWRSSQPASAFVPRDASAATARRAMRSRGAHRCRHALVRGGPRQPSDGCGSVAPR